MKLYIYPQARPHLHDTTPGFENLVPLSQIGITKHCEVVKIPEDADYFYMGQFSDASNNQELLPSNWQYFEQYPDRHILDIEGDWFNRERPKHLYDCIATVNGVPLKKDEPWFREGGRNWFIRPTFSKLLIHLAKNPDEIKQLISYNNFNSFAFKGVPDPFGVRYKTAKFFYQHPNAGECYLTNKWLAHTELDSVESEYYVQLMLRHNIALCPRGVGIDTVRFYEACALGRFPVRIGEAAIVGNEIIDDGSYMIDHETDENDLNRQLLQLLHMPVDEVISRGKAARNYFEQVIVPYFTDPTAYFLKWLTTL